MYKQKNNVVRHLNEGLHIEGIEEEFQLNTLISQEVKPVRDVSIFIELAMICFSLHDSGVFCLRLRFVKLWSMMHRGSIKTNQLRGANIQYVGWWISDGMKWWNGCRCQLVGRRNNSNWVLTKPDLEQSVRKVSEFFSRSFPATFILFKQRLNRGEQLWN